MYEFAIVKNRNGYNWLLVATIEQEVIASGSGSFDTEAEVVEAIKQIKNIVPSAVVK